MADSTNTLVHDEALGTVAFDPSTSKEDMEKQIAATKAEPTFKQRLWEQAQVQAEGGTLVHALKQTGAYQKAEAFVSKPLKELVPSGIFTPENVQYDIETLKHGKAPDLSKKPLIASREAELMSGTGEALGDTVNFFTSPLGIATLGMGKLPMAAQRAVSLYFAKQMASQMPEVYSQLQEQLKLPPDKRDYHLISKLVTSGGLNTAFAGAGLKHGLMPEKPGPRTTAYDQTEPAAPAGMPALGFETLKANMRNLFKVKIDDPNAPAPKLPTPLQPPALPTPHTQPQKPEDLAKAAHDEAAQAFNSPELAKIVGNGISIRASQNHPQVSQRTAVEVFDGMIASSEDPAVKAIRDDPAKMHQARTWFMEKGQAAYDAMHPKAERAIGQPSAKPDMTERISSIPRASFVNANIEGIQAEIKYEGHPDSLANLGGRVVMAYFQIGPDAAMRAWERGLAEGDMGLKRMQEVHPEVLRSIRDRIMRHCDAAIGLHADFAGKNPVPEGPITSLKVPGAPNPARKRWNSETGAIQLPGGGRLPGSSYDPKRPWFAETRKTPGLSDPPYTGERDRPYGDQVAGQTKAPQTFVDVQGKKAALRFQEPYLKELAQKAAKDYQKFGRRIAEENFHMGITKADLDAALYGRHGAQVKRMFDGLESDFNRWAKQNVMREKRDMTRTRGIGQPGGKLDQRAGIFAPASQRYREAVGDATLLEYSRVNLQLAAIAKRVIEQHLSGGEDVAESAFNYYMENTLDPELVDIRDNEPELFQRIKSGLLNQGNVAYHTYLDWNQAQRQGPESGAIGPGNRDEQAADLRKRLEANSKQNAEAIDALIEQEQKRKAQYTLTEHSHKLEMSGVRVPRKFRGEGLGSAAMAEGIAKAEAKKVPLTLKARAQTPELQPDLERFYERAGMVKYGYDEANQATMYRYMPKELTPAAKGYWDMYDKAKSMAEEPTTAMTGKALLAKLAAEEPQPIEPKDANAVNEGKKQESGQPQHQQTLPGGLPAKAGGGDSAPPSGQGKAQAPSGRRPLAELARGAKDWLGAPLTGNEVKLEEDFASKVRTMRGARTPPGDAEVPVTRASMSPDGTVYTAKMHSLIASEHPTTDLVEGYWTNKGRFVPRELGRQLTYDYILKGGDPIEYQRSGMVQDMDVHVVQEGKGETFHSSTWTPVENWSGDMKAEGHGYEHGIFVSDESVAKRPGTADVSRAVQIKPKNPYEPKGGYEQDDPINIHNLYHFLTKPMADRLRAQGHDAVIGHDGSAKWIVPLTDKIISEGKPPQSGTGEAPQAQSALPSGAGAGKAPAGGGAPPPAPPAISEAKPAPSSSQPDLPGFGEKGRLYLTLPFLHWGSGAPKVPGQPTRMGNLRGAAKSMYAHTIGLADQLLRMIQPKHLMSQTYDAANNAANLAGRQAGKAIKLRIPGKPGSAEFRMHDEAAYVAIEANRLQTSGVRDPMAELQRFMDIATAAKNRHAFDVARYAKEHFSELQATADFGKQLLDAQHDRERNAGMDMTRQESYVPHYYEGGVKTSIDGPVIFGQAARGLHRGFLRDRQFPTMYDAIKEHFVPRTLALSETLEHRVRVGERLVNRRAWADSLEKIEDPVLTREARKNDPNAPAVMVSAPETTAPDNFANVELYPGHSIKVNPIYANYFRALNGESYITGNVALGAVGQAAATWKHTALAVDSFHAFRMMGASAALHGKLFGVLPNLRAPFEALGGVVRKATGQPFMRGGFKSSGGFMKGHALMEYRPEDVALALARKEITPDTAKWITDNRPIADRVIKAGLNVGRIAENMYNDWMRQEAHPVLESVPVLGPAASWTIKKMGNFNKFVFTQLTRGAMLESAVIESKRMAKQFPHLTQEQVDGAVARDLNTLYGNLQRQGWLTSETMRDFSRIIFLAPQWVEAQVKSEFYGGANALYNDRLGGGNQVRWSSLPKAKLQGLVMFFIAAQLVNQYNRRKFTWENPEDDHKMDAYVNGEGDSKGMWMPVSGMAGEMTGEIIRYAGYPEPRHNIPLRILRNKLSTVGRLANTWATGEDPYGRKLSDDQFWGQQLADVAPTPLAATAARQAVSEKFIEKYGKAGAPGYRGDIGTMAKHQIYQSAGLRTYYAQSNQGMTTSTLRNWMAHEAPPATKEKYARSVASSYALSQYSPLRTALGIGDQEKATSEINKLLGPLKGEQRKKQEDLLIKDFHPRTYGYVVNPRTKERTQQWHWRPLPGLTSEEESLFEKSLTPNEHDIFLKARQEKVDAFRRLTEIIKQARSNDFK